MVDINGVNGRALVILLVVGGVMSTGIAAAASVSVDSGVPFRTNSGLTVTTGIDISQDLSSPFLDNETVELQNTTFSSQTGGNITVDQYSGPFTELSDIDANGHDIHISPSDKPNATVSGGVTEFEFADPALDDGKTDFVYAASSSGTITLNGLTPGVEVGAKSKGGDPIDAATVTANGSVTLTVDSRATTDVRLFTGTATPDIDNTAADPTGEVSVDGSIQLSIDIDDNDFATDTVTAEFYLDGNSVGTETLSSAGTANVSTTVTTGGKHNWRVVAKDGYGNKIQSDADAAAAGDQNFTFSLPAKLTVRNASNPSQLVDGGSVKVTFFGSQEVVTRQDSNQDGNISFDGLPLDQRFEADLTANNFSSRTVVIKSLFRTDTAYMLPESVKTVQPRFTLDSAVQSFDERESELIIERPINKNGSLKFAQINEQQFGVSGVDITLKKGQRYRLTVRAPNGETRQVGSYQATATEKVTLQIESGSFGAEQSVSGVEFASSFDASKPAVQATVRDANIRSSSVTVTRTNDSTVILDQTAAGNISVSVPAVNNTQYKVNMTATLDSGKKVSTTQRVSGGGIPAATALDSKWQNLLAMAMLLIVAGLFTRANAGIGAISTASIGGIFWFFGWLNGVATGLTVVVALFIGVIAYAKQQRSGVPT